MKKLVVSFVSAAALASASIAMAGGMDNMAAPTPASNSNAAGIIISGNAGYGKINFSTAGTGASSSVLRGFAWNGNLGYQFNPYVAIESGYTHFHDINFGPGKIDTYGVDLLAKGIYPINSQFNVFAKAGAMDIFSKALINNTTVARVSRVTPEFGIGTSYNMTHNLALTVQGITTLAMKGPHAGTGTMPATYAGYAGLSYKFNV
jgi:OmpA-OmpF porin, OOP family